MTTQTNEIDTETQVEIEEYVLADMGLPTNTLCLDGDRVLSGRSDVATTDLERKIFASCVHKSLKSGRNEGLSLNEREQLRLQDDAA